MGEPVYVFDWHEKQKTDDSLEAWMIPTLIAHLHDSKVEELTERTDKWSRVELGITINGVAVDPKHLIEMISRNYELHVARRAENIIKELGLDELTNFLYEAQKEIIFKLRQDLKSKGYEISEDDGW